MVGLQQRLLSSIEAFARSRKVHRATVKRHREAAQAVRAETGKTAHANATLFTSSPDADDERGARSTEQVEDEEAVEIEVITAAAPAESNRDRETEALWTQE